MAKPTPRITLSLSLTLLAVLAFGVFGCSVDGYDLRPAQYPADFHYITRHEIRTTMGELAREVVALDALIGKEGGPTEADREAILEILERMRSSAGKLKQGEHSNHPRIDRNAPRLREDIDRAIAEVRMSQPPIYYRAGQVVGACTYCHVPRHERGY